MKQFAQLIVPGFDNQPITAPNGIPNPGDTSSGQVIAFILGILLAVAVLGSIGMILWGAITWITSQGDKQKVQKARGTIVAAVIGLIIVLLSFVIISAIGTIVGSRILANF